MSETMAKNMAVINGLNAVEGFDPAAFLRKLQSEAGEEQLYLDVKYRKLWFRLKYPMGKITKRIIKLENDYAIIESRVYLDRNDSEDSYISCAMAQRWRTEDDAYGKKYVESAETAAVGRALADAGFGIQFAEPGEERDPNPVDAPITLPKINENDLPPEEDEPLPEEPAPQPQKTGGDARSEKSRSKSRKKEKLSEDMSVEELTRKMTLDDAKAYIIPMGIYEGKTMGELCLEKPSVLPWYVDSYGGRNNLLRAAAKVLLDAAK